MTSMSGEYATAVSDGDGLSPPSPQEQELILDAWREALAQALHARDCEWKDKLRVMAAESMAAIAELRAAAAEFRSTMEAMTAERLAQIRPTDGREGPRGERGQKGEKGEPGELPMVRAWTEDDVSYTGDCVFCDGGTWQARKDTSKKPPHADWKPLALPGRNAAFPVIRGTYREGEEYCFLNIVALNGSSFIARQDQPGPCPGDGWQLIASAGRAGKPGEKGERGEPGRRGERGPSGPTILTWKIDRENYTATPIMSDDSGAPPLELRGLFEQFDMETR